jgi:hypothetical protein
MVFNLPDLVAYGKRRGARERGELIGLLPRMVLVTQSKYSIFLSL